MQERVEHDPLTYEVVSKFTFCHSACSVCVATDMSGKFETISDQLIPLSLSVQTVQLTSLLNMQSDSMFWQNFVQKAPRAPKTIVNLHLVEP